MWAPCACAVGTAAGQVLPESSVVGPTNAASYTQFDDLPHYQFFGPITSLGARVGANVDGLVVTHGGRSGLRRTLYHGSGGSVPLSSMWELEAGERIIRITGCSGEYIQQVQFVTNKGMRLSALLPACFHGSTATPGGALNNPVLFV